MFAIKGYETNGTKNVSKFYDYKTIAQYLNSHKK